MFQRALLILIILLSTNAYSQVNKEFKEEEIILTTATGNLHGSLVLPNKKMTDAVVLIISGTGPTDRDGNNSRLKNDALKKLAIELSKSGISSVRYDKRGVATSEKAGPPEKDLRVETFIMDAKAWVDRLKNDVRFKQVIVLGQSEGALIGLYAAEWANKYISISGSGYSTDIILKQQFESQPQKLAEQVNVIVDSIKRGYTAQDIPEFLEHLFRPSLQTYMRSLFLRDPQVQIKKLQIPILILQGTKDLQTTVNDAQQLYLANTKSTLRIIENMNYVFTIVESVDKKENISSYNNPGLPISVELTKAIVDFVTEKKLE